MDLQLENSEINIDLLDEKTPDQLLNSYTELKLKNKAIEQSIEEFKLAHKDIFDKLNEMMTEISNNNVKQNSIKEELVESMNKANVDSIANKMFKAKFVASTIRHDFDKDKFQKENEELYNNYLKETNVKAYIKITEVK